ncbi:MAG: DUF4296 domain-containing protein [Bacteroidia bacterium]|nr:DUF4296 domain-containing protein [Bacteroidia bacterium]
MKTILTLLFLSTILIACGDKNKSSTKKMTGKKPLLTSKQVVKVAVQIHLVASANASQLLADSNKIAPLNAYQELIYQQQKTNYKNYTYAYNYYAQNADTLLWIYEEIITQLSVLQAKESK